MSILALPKPSMPLPKLLLGLSAVLLALALIFGFLNTSKVKGLRGTIETATSEKQVAERARIASETKWKSREKAVTAAEDKIAAAETKASTAEADLSKTQNEKAELESKLQASEGQIADLQKRVADATVGGAAGSAGIAPNDLKKALDDAKQQLQTAEQEKSLLADKVKAAQDRVATMEEEKNRRDAGSGNPGVRGIVLAVNQAYNFVVLGIGERQGVVANSELMVMRQGSLIGKIRVSSVEPTTSIGDIITNSLARGVQVQPGDTVIYAGSTHS